MFVRLATGLGVIVVESLNPVNGYQMDSSSRKLVLMFKKTRN